MSEKWWVETEPGEVVFGPCISRQMAISVRAVIEGLEHRDDLWVRRNDKRAGWTVWTDRGGEAS